MISWEQCLINLLIHTMHQKIRVVMLTFLLAIENISLIFAAPLFSLSVNSAPAAKTNGNPLSFASVLAKRVLPVPGGPERRTP